MGKGGKQEVRKGRRDMAKVQDREGRGMME
jgi:hypothetical protein